MKKAAIRCFECGEGTPRLKEVEHDVGPLLGLDEVRVTNLPALVCPRCGAVTVDGKVLDTVGLALAAFILQRPELDGVEVRFLRKLLGYTQSELAERLAVDRATVNRWENGPEPLRGVQAYAVRSHAFLRLGDLSPTVEATKESLVAPPSAMTAAKHHPRYRLEGAAVLAA